MNKGKKKYAIIVAGGSGSRMNRSTPKQFIPIKGRPVLMHTIQRFADYSKTLSIILVLPASQIEEWKKLTIKYNFNVEVQIISGGETRFQSVKNGLSTIEEMNSLVAIHDGVRPFVNKNIIEESFIQAEKYGNAVTSVPLKDSIRYATPKTNKAEDRSKFKLIQTPQTFKTSLIKAAYETMDANFTDDAGVLEFSGHAIQLIDGSYENIKITTPEDLIIAEAMLDFFKY